MSSSTPQVQRTTAAATAAAPAAARTPTVAPLIAVSSTDVVAQHQKTFHDICQQYIDEPGWSSEQQRVLGEIFSKFAHNVFATVRKNITTSSSSSSSSAAPGTSAMQMVEPLDRQLVGDVEALDSELDAVSARVAALRKEVPQLMDELVQQQVEVVAAAASPSTVEPAAAAAVGSADAPGVAVGGVIAHVASEIRALAAEFQGVKKDIDTAVTDCTSTLGVVKATLGKGTSATQQAILVAGDISNNAAKRKSAGGGGGDKSAVPQKRAAVISKENE